MTDTLHLLIKNMTDYERFLLGALITQEEKTKGHTLNKNQQLKLAEQIVARHSLPKAMQKKRQASPSVNNEHEVFQWRKPVPGRWLFSDSKKQTR